MADDDVIQRVPQTEEAREAEELQPTAVKTWTLGSEGGEHRVYQQKKLGFIKKFRFFALLGGVIRSAVATSGEGAVGDLLGGATSLRERAEQLSSTDLRDAEQFLNLASSILIYVPDFLEQAYCEWLSIPFEERDWAKKQMEKDADEGGLSDEAGVEIINTFIRQNWGDLRDFFGLHLRSVVETAQEQTRTSSEEKEEVVAG